MKRPIGISVIVSLQLLMIAYTAATMWRVLRVAGFGSLRGNVLTGLELILLGFLWLGFEWARLLSIAWQVWVICVTIYNHFRRPSPYYVAEVVNLVFLVIPVGIIAYLCMPHVRTWFHSRYQKSKDF